VVAPGRFHAGRVVVADIGLPPLATRARRATDGILRTIPLRAPHDSKYTAGAVLVLGGSPGMVGAAVLAATAALRADAGYVTLAVPNGSLEVAETLALEPVKRAFAWDTALDDVEADLARASAVALGPGLGRTAEARALVRALLERVALPVVVDADALHGLAPFARDAPTVLTPHAGELARLLEVEAAWIAEHRLEAAALAAERFGCVVLLKGADTIVSAPGEPPIVCDLGPPSLATAGSGDVLTGVIAAFLAKGVEPRTAAAAAAVAHGIAAASVPHQAGLVASDVAAALPAALG
jgi:NAD(P)H-hydrate epimerase